MQPCLERKLFVSQVQIIGIDAIPEIQPNDALAEIILRSAASSQITMLEGDILVVTHKIVSKSEGQLVDLTTIEPSPFATSYASTWGKDARQIEVVLRESARIVRMDHGIMISETRHGFVCANAGVDASNVPGPERVCLLPKKPDESAETLRQQFHTALGFDVPVVISDSWGRPWREGIVNVAIGVAGLVPLTDYRGMTDPWGLRLQASVLAVADELAAAAELVMGKIDGRPVAIVRGYSWQSGVGTGRDLLMDSRRDMFR
ncbi:MAG: coenzyme F420-0:L-glutamate ligase [Herpetosiphonaceae bacterium]|nr:coenzyme F420-0:L-glutamate ligase [Herpetosiphonaceae bacterium]